MQHVGEPQRSLGELFSELANETSTLVKKEVELATTEMTMKAKVAAVDGGVVGLGVGVAAAGALAIFAGVILFLGTYVMPLWAAALAMGAFAALAGVAIAYVAVRSLKRMDKAPRQTLRTLQENKQWLRMQAAR